MPRAPKPRNDIASLARAARAHLRRADALGKSLDARTKEKMRASDVWSPDEEWRRDFASVTAVLQHTGNALTKALEANRSSLADLSDEQLAAQFRSELVSSAQSLSDEDFAAICDARAKAGR